MPHADGRLFRLPRDKYRPHTLDGDSTDPSEGFSILQGSHHICLLLPGGGGVESGRLDLSLLLNEAVERGEGSPEFIDGRRSDVNTVGELSA